jgi:ribosomal protein S2
MSTSSRSLTTETEGSQLHRRGERWVGGTLTEQARKGTKVEAEAEQGDI